MFDVERFTVSRSEWDPTTLDERPYDVENAKRAFAEANERWRIQSAERQAQQVRPHQGSRSCRVVPCWALARSTSRWAADQQPRSGVGGAT